MTDRRSQSSRAPAMADAQAAQIAEALPPLAPPPERVSAMRAALLARVRADASRFVTVRSGDGAWVPLTPKIALKMLEDDGAMRSFLLKVKPGGSLRPHDHAGDELCVVLEGDFSVDGVELGPGDFHLARAGSHHGEVSSRGGCIVFLRMPSQAIPRI